MPKTIQIRDLDDEVYAGLLRRAAELGVSVPELLRIEAARLASRPSISSWLERTRGAPSSVESDEVLAVLDEQRGPWPGERFGHLSCCRVPGTCGDPVRGWDATYVALAEALEAVLLTRDARLATASGPRCQIEVV